MTTRKPRIAFSALLLILITLEGCSSTKSAIGSYDSQATYGRPLYSTIAKRSMAYEGVERNPVIVVHGFLGALLQDSKTGENVYGSFTGMNALSGFPDEQLKKLAVPMRMGEPLKDLQAMCNPLRSSRTSTSGFLA